MKARIKFVNSAMIDNWWNDMNTLGKIVLSPVWACFYVSLFFLTLFIKESNLY